ncbi:glyceraldehyde-3-phosphate dehydrogenase 1 [Mortierella sp. GBA39]|nr:glyceraldehyde-3-phosphate dehydrogenase 1 [Mortierella sp. GBA39]
MVRAVAAAAAASSDGTGPNSPGPLSGRKGSISTTRSSYRYSQLYSMAAEQDVEVEDDLARAQKRLRELKTKISSQSKKNFVLERDVRYLDSRIALLIQNRMAIAEAIAEHLEEADSSDGLFPDDRKLQSYGNLFFLLQTEPRHIATLCRLVSLTEIDTLLQTVMFTLYGNQYESREEHLLLTMFQSVLSAQFETATEFGSLLRANTPVSRMMTTYTRRGPGQSYLKTVLSERINSLIEHKELNLEVNPLKVYEQMINQIEENTGSLPPHLPRGVPPETAAANPDVQAIIAPRLSMVMEIANSKYPDATDFSICSLIGGFFFLRFINPAIVTPQAYMLVDGLPSKHPRRTLTLIAKLLQNLANKPSYAKEAYMMTLNPFVENNKARINKFLNDLCEVGDFYESLEMDQYMALSKKEINLNITMNELFNTHQLLTQHRDTLAPQEKHHLRMCLNELGPAPPQVPRKENKTIILPLFSRWETPIQDLHSTFLQETNITQADIMYMETKSILVQLIRSIPGIADKRPLDLMKIAETAATTKDAILVRKGIKVKEMLIELEALNVVDDHFTFMTEEVTEELRHLGNLREKVNEEAASLESVYKTIGDHNNYLRSQLDSYKAYLQNVRMQSGGGNSPGQGSGVGVVTVGGKEAKKGKQQVLGPFKFTHHQLEKDGVIAESNVPENRRSNIFFNITSPIPGTFIIALHYKGRDKAILEMDLKLDDLLEKQQDQVQLLDLEYVHLNVNKVLALLTKTFIKR